MNWMSALGLDALIARYRAGLIEGAIAVEDRLQLARLEWRAQRAWLQTVLILVIALGGLTVVAMVLLSMAVLIHFWDTAHRSLVAWIVAGVWLAAWGAVLYTLVRLLRHSSRSFAMTRAELAHDWSVIKEKL